MAAVQAPMAEMQRQIKAARDLPAVRPGVARRRLHLQRLLLRLLPFARLFLVLPVIVPPAGLAHQTWYAPALMLIVLVPNGRVAI